MELQAVNHVVSSLLVQKVLSYVLVLEKIEHIHLKTPHVDALLVLILKIQKVSVMVNLVHLKIVSLLYMTTVVKAL